MFRNGLKVRVLPKINWNLVGWVIFIILILFMTCNELRSEPAASAYELPRNVPHLYFEKDHVSSIVEIYIDKELVATVSLKELTAIVSAADFYQKLTEAENNERVYIKLEDSIWKLKEKDFNKFVTGMEMIWKDEKGKILKTITIEATIKDVEIEESKVGLFRRYYTKVAEFGFPITLLLLIILI